MKLYEFTLEVQDGENEYVLSRFVAASTPQAAARFAKNTAKDFQPFARYDAHSNWWEGRGGYPVWRIGSMREVNEIVVPSSEGAGVVVFAVQQVYRTEAIKPRPPPQHNGG